MLIDDFLIITPSYNRIKLLVKHIRILAEAAKEDDVIVQHHVFDDGSTEKYEGPLQELQEEYPDYKIIYHREPVRHGRPRFTEFYTKMLQTIRPLSFRYVIGTSDDVMPCKNFFLRMTAHFEQRRYEDGSIVATTCCWFPGSSMWGTKRYVDMGFFGIREFLDALEWKIDPPKTSWLNNPSRSSGVGIYMTNVLKRHPRYNLAPWDGESFILISDWGKESKLFEGQPEHGKSTEERDKLFVDHPTHTTRPRSRPATADGLPLISVVEVPKPKKVEKAKEPSTIKLTVIMPMFRAKYIGWLPFESLIVQKDIDFKWELLVAEEVEEESFGVEEILKYQQRLEAVGCVNLKYIGLQEWIPLATKWTMLVHMAAETSEVLCSHSADYYAPPNKLARHIEVFSDPTIVWHQPRRSIHYLIKTGNMVLQDATKVKRKDNVIGTAMRTQFFRGFPANVPQRTGIDGWMLKRYRGAVKKAKVLFKIFPELESDDWKNSITTIGFNNISPKRRLPRVINGLSFTEYKEDLRQYIPPFIIDKLEASREFLPKHKRALPQNRSN